MLRVASSFILALAPVTRATCADAAKKPAKGGNGREVRGPEVVPAGLLHPGRGNRRDLERVIGGQPQLDHVGAHADVRDGQGHRQGPGQRGSAGRGVRLSPSRVPE